MQYREQIQKTVLCIRTIEDLIPGSIIIHDIRDWTVAYISRQGRELLGLGEDEYYKLGIEAYHQHHFNPEDAAHYVPKLHAMLQRNQEEEVLAFFQQVRIAPAFEWVWHVSAIKVLMRDNEGIPLLTITISAPVDPENEITLKMERILQENNFIRNNISRFNLLGRREREILTALSKGKNTSEIAEEFFISAHTVNTHRKNIKAKLGVSNAYELSEFARAFNLI